MDNPIDALIDILTQETVIYQRMVEILHQESVATIASSLDGLHAARSDKEMLINAISQLERRRVVLTHALNRDWFNASGPVSFSRLVARLDLPTAQRLTRSREALVTTLVRVNDMNTRNASLLAHSVKWVAGAMRLLDHLLNPQAVYRRSGRFAPTGRTGRVLSGTY
ncbi:MAG: flagellar protein FlgN [Pseudomonadota bacterium]